MGGPKQIEAGIDIGNNGEQQREAFFLYLRHRLSGFGGGWNRRCSPTWRSIPGFRDWKTPTDAVGASVSNTARVPEAIGEVRYLDRARSKPNATIFAPPLDASAAAGFAEPFMTAPSPGIVAAAMRNAYYDTEDAYLDALGAACRSSMKPSWRMASCCRSTRRTWRWSGTSYQDRPLADFVGFVERVVAAINRALVNIPPDRVRLHACWGNYEGPHDCDVALSEILPAIRQAKVGGFVLPFANPRHAHEHRCLHAMPLDVGPGDRRRRDRHADQFRRASGSRCRSHRSCRGGGRRSAPGIAGTDCGFDTSAGRGRVAEDVVWAKLAPWPKARGSPRVGCSGDDDERQPRTCIAPPIIRCSRRPSG